MKKILPFIFTILVFAVSLSACSFSLAADVTPPPGYQAPTAPQSAPKNISGPLYPLVPPDPAKGETIYAEKCAPCHGESGKGDGPRAAQLPNPVTAIGDVQVARQSTPAEWYRIVTQGNIDRFMPPFNSLSDRERWDVVAYAYQLGTTEAALAQGEMIYQANCAVCHGEQGQGDGPEASGLPTAPTSFLNQAWISERSAADFFTVISSGRPPAMPAFSGQLADEERWSVSDYIRSLSFTSPGQPVAVQATSGPESTPRPAQAGSSDVEPTPAGDGVDDTIIQEASGTITGTVTNDSGGSLPSDLIVTLHGIDGMQLVITQTTTVRSDGTFIFPDVEFPVGRFYAASVEFGGSRYRSEFVSVEPDTSSLSLPIQVFETSTDTSVLVVDRLHLFFEFIDASTLRVIELYILSNPGSTTIVAQDEGGPVLSFELPEGASTPEFQDGVLGGRYLATPGGFADTIPIRPGTGTHQVLFAFDMPYDRKLELVQPVSLQTNAVVVLVPAGSIKVKGENFQDAGAREAEGIEYQMYNGGSLAAGEELRLTINGKPLSSSATLSTGSNSSLVVGLAAFGLVLILAGVWLFMRNRAAVEAEDPDEELSAPVEPAAENADTIMDAILALDDLYRAGQLPEEAYLERRGELKDRLKEIMG